MGIRISCDRHECRVMVETQEETGTIRAELEKIAGKEKNIVMPDEIIKNKSGYEMVFKNRHSVKEYLCFEGFDEKEYGRFIASLNRLFCTAERNCIDPYSFVFDINCMFCEGDLRETCFVFTPGSVNEKNNLCSDVLSLISLYSGYETDSPMEKIMRDNTERVRNWEETCDADSEDLSGRYRFPIKEKSEKNGSADKYRGRIVCLSKTKPYITVLSCRGEESLLGIGRDSQWANLLTDSIFTSRKHAVIMYRNGLFYIEDLKSKNGTVLNGKRMAPEKEYELSTFNRIETGKDSRFILVCGL